jgi:hypothetical protein
MLKSSHSARKKKNNKKTVGFDSSLNQSTHSRKHSIR